MHRALDRLPPSVVGPVPPRAAQASLRVVTLVVLWLLLAGATQAAATIQTAEYRAFQPATAQPIDSRSREHSKHTGNNGNASRRQAAIAPETAAERARQRFGGRVLNVVLERGPGGPYYRVKILEHGRVRVVDIDARR
ncbi:PepSY domain-containing protein [Salinisphaera sp. SPP-AMP-43]|uniref:PepSY domain-containing protein n=1 Tax=Salinisphaera sp. SPP-AMP-43 TaxID=3121288 RepID=UPI003C6E244D